MDQIKSCTVSKDSENNIVQYDLAYDVEHNDHINSFCIVVKADELTIVDSLDEVKEKANLKAKEIKDAWVLTLPSDSTEVVAEKIDVTL